MCGGDDDFIQGFLAPHHVSDVERRMRTQSDLGIGHAPICIKQHDLVSPLGQSHCKVDGDGGLARPAFATCHPDHLGVHLFIHSGPLFSRKWSADVFS